MNEIVTTCRKTWRRLGVPRAQADAMASELAADLASAAEDGVDPWSYVASDPKGFASGWAEARGLVRPRRRILTTAVAAVLGAIPGAFFGLFVAYGLSSDAFAEIFGDEVHVGGDLYETVFEPPELLLLALYALGGVIAYAGALAAVAAILRWRLDPAASPTVRLLAALLPAALVAAVVASMAFAWKPGLLDAARGRPRRRARRHGRLRRLGRGDPGPGSPALHEREGARGRPLVELLNGPATS